MKTVRTLFLTLPLVALASASWGQETAPAPTLATPAEAAPTPAPAPAPKPVKGSLYKAAAANTPVPITTDSENPHSAIASASYMAVSPAQARKFKKHDLVTVIVREDSTNSSTGKGDSKKTQDFDFALQQFLQLNAYGNGAQGIGVAANPSKLPQVQFKYNNDRQNDATQQRTDSMSMRISASIVDVKPNGTLVLQATKHVRADKEEQNYTLSGVCRAEDIAADNTVLSTQLAELNVVKDTRGEVRDGIKSGWLNKAIDAINPF